MNEAVVVGGGLAGGAVATMLAMAGKPVRLIEREPEPSDKVCGEFLSIEAQRILGRVGIDLDHLGASSISTLRLASGRRTIEASLPFVARGLTRKRLDAVLLDRAATAGARVHRGTSVRSIGNGRVETTSGSFSPTTLLLASGKHEIRGAARDVSKCDNGYVGFKSYWKLPVRTQVNLRGRVSVILFEGGYAGLQLIEGGLANLCLLVSKRRLAALGGTWPELLKALLREPYAARTLGDAELCSPKPLTISGVPYGFLHGANLADDVFRLGDQAAVIPSFCGEGMAIALHSAAVAASVVTQGGSAADHSRILQREFKPSLRLAMALQRSAQRSVIQYFLLGALRLQPGLIKHVAQMTRVPVGSP